MTGDSRGFFDTSRGLYGGNEFEARSPEGKITVANPSAAKAQAPAPAATVPSGAAQSQPAAGVPPVAAAAPAVAPQTAVSSAGETAIAIDANAFDAVFGAAAAPVKPSAEQLMRPDSLSLIASAAARADLQQKILACRRAGDACRLSRNKTP